jgi:hypothetical protein
MLKNFLLVPKNLIFKKNVNIQIHLLFLYLLVE